MNMLKHLLWTAAGVLGLLAGWGLAEPYLTDVERRAAEVPGLPPAWEGRSVAQISDWQVGMWLDNEPTIRRITDRIIEEEPALVLITGDFIYHPHVTTQDELRRVAALLRPLAEANLPVYAVLGNHDYGATSLGKASRNEVAQAVRRTLQNHGVRVLHNEAVPLPGEAAGSTPAARRLHLVGIGPSWPGEARPAAALAEVPDAAPRIVMMHNPNAFDRLPPRAAPLAVAGHTHGGQIRLPFLPAWTWLTFVQSDKVHTDGWIDGYGKRGNRLYVNRGIGFSALPLRINCMPELTLFTLRSSS